MFWTYVCIFKTCDVSVVVMMRCMLLSVHFSVILSMLVYTFLITVLSEWHVLLFLLILCYCCCAHDNDVSHTLHREWGVTPMNTFIMDKDVTEPSSRKVTIPP